MTTNKTLIVAEIGNNHEGSADAAAQLVQLAAEAGVDAVKFQAFHPERLVRHQDEQRISRLQRFQLPLEQFAKLAELARSLGLRFLITPLDVDTARECATFADGLKIASGDLTFQQLIQTIGSSCLPVVLSTGMATLAEVHTALTWLTHARTDAQPAKPRTAGEGSPPRAELPDLSLLHCVSAYPAPRDQVNLRAINTLAMRFQKPVGYSDHTTGIDACVAAVAAGATIIEKHFTLDHNYSDFRDHQLSADPTELRTLVHGVRDMEHMLGDGLKQPLPCEQANRRELRRSVAWRRPLPAGQTVLADDLTWLRPGEGVAPADAANLIGRQLLHAVHAGSLVAEFDLAPVRTTRFAATAYTGD